MYAQVVAVINQLSSNFEQTVLIQKVRKALAKRLHEYLPLFFGKIWGRGSLKFWFLGPQRVLFENILLSYHMLNRNFTNVKTSRDFLAQCLVLSKEYVLARYCMLSFEDLIFAWLNIQLFLSELGMADV